MTPFTNDPLEEWAVHCQRRAAEISLDSSGAPPPFGDPAWEAVRFSPANNEAEAEGRLKEALSRAYGVDEDMIALAQGAQHAGFLFFLSHLRPGDLAAVENPTFMPIRKQVEHLGRALAFDRCPESSYVPRREQVEGLLSKGARVLALTNLHNPSGAVLSEDRTAGLVEGADRKGAMVLSDEVYREMAYGPVPRATFHFGENAVSVSSVTKLNGLRGLRAGWLIGAPDVVRKVEAARIYTSYRLPAITCEYAAEAVKRREWFRERALRTAERNLPELKGWLESEPRIACRLPDGALMAHLRLPPGIDDLDLSERLLDSKVAVGPGRYWGAPGTIRVTFSCSRSELASGLGAISSILDAIGAPR